MSRVACPFLALAILGLARSAHAQANYDGVELGGHTAMMGGAGVARGSDGATAFINPAGLTRIPGESFSFQTVAVSASLRYLPDLLDPSADLGVTNPMPPAINVRILPNTFCLFLDGPPKEKSNPRSRHKYGICAADTEQDALVLTENRVSPVGANSPGVSHQTGLRWQRSTLALSWALQLAMPTSIGVTARIENSRLEDFIGATSYQISGSSIDMFTMTHNRAAQSWDAGVVVGISHQFSHFFTMGASLSSPTQHFYGVYKSSDAFSASTQGSQSLVQDRGDFRYNQPSNLRLGLAFTWPKFNFELDGSLYFPSDELASATFDRAVVTSEQTELQSQVIDRGFLSERANTVVNVMAGLEAFFAPDFSLVAGLQTDFSGLTPRQSGLASETLFRERRSGAHGSIGVVSYGSAGSLLLGLRGYYLSGALLAGDPSTGQPVVTPVSQSEIGLSVIVSGQISFEAVRDTAYRAASPFTRPNKTGSPQPGGESQK